MNHPCLSVLMLISLIFSAKPSFAKPWIEGVDAKAMRERAETLKSVISLKATTLQGNAYLCSTSLIAPNILLTARHCVVDQTGARIFKDGANIILNGSENYKAVKVIAQPQDEEIVGNGQRVNTDIALVLFSPKKQTKETLKGMRPLPVASQSLEALASTKLLLAGYGQSKRFYSNSYGTLGAGYSEGFYKDYSRNETGRFLVDLFARMSNDMVSMYRGFFSKDEIKFLDAQVQGVVLTVAVPGKELKVNEIPFNVSRTKNAAALHGDSGGPALSFDVQSGAASIVGVASAIVNNIVPTSKEILVIAGDQEVLRVTVQKDAAGKNKMKEALNEVLLQLMVRDFINDQTVVLKPFTMAISQEALAISLYSSVFASQNAAFIQNGVADLSDLSHRITARSNRAQRWQNIKSSVFGN